MQRHKSAIKRNKQSKAKNIRNSSQRSALRTAVKKFEQSVQQKDAAQAASMLKAAIPLLDKAANKGVIHRNKASRKISRLTRKINQVTSPAPA